MAAFPNRNAVAVALRSELARRGGTSRPRDRDADNRTVYESLAMVFGLRVEQLSTLTSDGEGRPKWENLVRWARQHLVEEGDLHRTPRGTWRLTADGRRRTGSGVVPDRRGSSDAWQPEERDLPPAAEGARRRVVVNVYERSEANRRACITKYGTTCTVCGFDFARVYGPAAAGVIHVHHLHPLSRLGPGVLVDGTVDLRPVCPNCHVVLHLGGLRTIEEVQAMIRTQAVRESDG